MHTVGIETKERILRSTPAWVYGLTVLVSSCLLFWVQPLAVRGLLPVMGGAPLVWNTAMLFFQGTLLAGYVMAHVVARRLPPTIQLGVLGCLWCAALLAAWAGGFGNPFGDTPPQSGVVLPVLWLLGALAATYGAGCLAVSMLAPLVSAWLSRSRETLDPYVLYAVSNAGSIGVLLLYPFILEPLFGVERQLWMWHTAFAGVFPMLVALGRTQRLGWAESPSDLRTAPDGMAPRTACRVLALAFLPGALLHGVTLSLSTDVAAAPFLWVAPLALYLGTYALAFGRRQVFRRCRGALSRGPVPAGLVLFAVLHGFTDMGLWWGVFHLSLFGMVALWCHGLLWELRPQAGELTRFYVLIASGGLLGGLFAVLAAPLLFVEVWEYPILFGLAALVLPVSTVAGWPSWQRVWALLSVTAASSAIACLHVDSLPVWVRLGAVLFLMLGLPGLWLLRPRPALLAPALLVLSLSPAAAWTLRGGEVIARERTWFGVYRVVEMAGEGVTPGRLRLFFHGTTLHGMAWQKQDEKIEHRMGYYAPEGPYGDVMRGLRRRQDNLRMGVVGLGAGSLLCYAQTGDAVSVYEIDPAVVSLARSQFTALEGCAPQAAVKVGDGRLLLAREPAEAFDALFLDAFSSGSIPVHLLTLEAIQDYLRVLDADGVLAVHISNRHLELDPLLALIADELGLAGAVRLYKAPRWSEPGALPMMTHLAVLARDTSTIDDLELGNGWRPLAATRPTWWRRAWTDDCASLVPYLR
ncbi:MAG: fused MFS/spermidine synthase [Candidatus Tectomicrobia bacterium]|nr:fused MFS/spermidine synthase [Candidatus Tectomicrobia bacterium]